MEITIKTDSEDEAQVFMNAHRVRHNLFELHGTLRMYIKHGDRTPENDAKTIDTIYADLCNLTFEEW